MAVSLPTAAEVRKAREQAAQSVAERAVVARTPLLAVLGAGDLAVTTVTRVVTDVRERAAVQAEATQGRVAELPQRISADELRRIVADLREQAEKRYAELTAQAEQTYAEFAARGEQAWGRIRTQPQVKHAIATIEVYTEKLDAGVDGLVDEASGATERALTVVTRQTRSVGEKAAQATQRVAGQAAEAVSDAGAETAEVITEAGDEAARTTRSTTRKAANRTAPATTPRKPAPRKSES